MNRKQKTVMLRFLRTLGATIASSALTVVANPQAWSHHWKQAVITILLVPTLTATEKALRYGGDPGEGEDNASEIS